MSAESWPKEKHILQTDAGLCLYSAVLYSFFQLHSTILSHCIIIMKQCLGGNSAKGTDIEYEVTVVDRTMEAELVLY